MLPILRQAAVVTPLLSPAAPRERRRRNDALRKFRRRECVSCLVSFSHASISLEILASKARGEDGPYDPQGPCQ